MEIIVEDNKRTDILKIIAIIAMLIDHIGYAFYPQHLFLRGIGRLAFPIFAYHVVIGYRNTSNLKNYAIRLGIFAIISQLPFSFFGRGFNIFFTLLLGLLSIYLFERKERSYKIILTLLLFLLAITASSGFRFDYGVYGVLTVLIFHMFYMDSKKTFIGFTILTLLYCIDMGYYLQMLAVAAVPLFYVDWGMRVRLNKYVYYCFYPLHITIIVFIAARIFR